MPVPSPNILLALFIVSFSLSAIFHRSTIHGSNPSQPNAFSRYAADILVPSTNDTFASRPAAFGGVFDSVLQGELIKCWDDGLACAPPGKDEGERFVGKVVLVQRGNCAFAEKVREVQRAGGVAVVVGDNTPSSGLLTMYAKGDTSDITIPSTFIPHTSYLSLSYLLTISIILSITILPSTASDWPLLDTLLLVVLSPLFTLACIYILLLLRRRVQRRRELAPLSLVKSLPTRRWTREKEVTPPGEGESSASPVMPQGYGTRTTRVEILECVVCLEDFVEGDVVITLPCHHEFHESCILCPICKRDIIVPEQSGEVSESSPLLQIGEQPGSSADWRGDTAGNSV